MFWIICIGIALIVPVVRRFLFDYLPKIPSFLYWKVIDLYRWIKYKQWEDFNGFGLHIYVGLFGMGKTIAMVNSAYNLARRYKKMKILTNIELSNFPPHTEITKLENYMQIVNCGPDTLILIDEISSLFQSRNWANFPMPLLSQLLQVRKSKKMIYATAQRFGHVDKLMRDVTYSVRDCNNFWKRFQFIKTYYAWEYEEQNIMMPAVPIAYSSFIATDACRQRYDTMELIDNLKKSDFLSNIEILEKQGSTGTVTVVQDYKKPSLLGGSKKVKR